MGTLKCSKPKKTNQIAKGIVVEQYCNPCPHVYLAMNIDMTIEIDINWMGKINPTFFLKKNSNEITIDINIKPKLKFLRMPVWAIVASKYFNEKPIRKNISIVFLVIKSKKLSLSFPC